MVQNKYNLDLITKGLQNQECLLDGAIFDSVKHNWQKDVEQQCFEYFMQNQCEEPHHTLRLIDEKELTFDEFMLLERDPYSELVKQIEYF